VLKKSELQKLLVKRICEIKTNEPILVAIDGVDTSGKTTLANELKELITDRPVIRLSIDGFHNPEEKRIQKGDLSPDGYYYDSFNYDYLTKNVFARIKSGTNPITPRIFDFRSESVPLQEQINIPTNSVIIFEGVFLLRKELFDYWDFKIFLDISFKTAIERAKKRDIDYFNDMNLLHDKYNFRYIPGQKIYFKEENPVSTADIVIDYNDYENPVILKDNLGNNI